MGFNASIGAIHQGASFIEKHICLNKKIGIDSIFLEVKDLPLFKKEIHDAFLSRGKISYGPTKNELSNLQFRRSIYAVKKIKKDEKFTKENIKVIRPSLGLKPKYYDYIIGKKNKKSYQICKPNSF